MVSTAQLLLQHKDRHLATRTKEFFDNAPMINISTWLTRIKYALAEKESEKKKKKYDIRTWMNSNGSKHKYRTEKKIECRLRYGRNKKTDKNMQEMIPEKGKITAYFCK